MAAPANTPEDTDLLPSSADFDDDFDPTHDYYFDEEDDDAVAMDHAAMRIQAARRGKLARNQVAKKRHGDRLASGQSLTPEIAAKYAHTLAATPDGLGWACKCLTAVGVRLNSLADGLARLPNLTSVDLSDNRLISLEGLELLPRLSSLVCRGNRLQGVLDFPCPAGLHGLPGVSLLRHADLRHNAISGAISLPVDASGRAVGVDAHPALETLLLDHNKLRSLRGIDVLSQLRQLSASDNQLLDTAGAGALTRLTQLDLSQNSLTTCEELASMERLQTCKLCNNKLGSLPSLGNVSALSYLDLASNALPGLEALTKAIGGGQSRLLKISPLVTLNVASNPLLDGREDVRLELLHQLPNLAMLDGEEVAPKERVFAHNLHGRDSEQLAEIRRVTAGGFSDKLNTAEHLELPKMLAAYRHQYTKAFKQGRVADVRVAKGAGFWR
jgi:Leucine-rich repeat (LRR) protein